MMKRPFVPVVALLLCCFTAIEARGQAADTAPAVPTAQAQVETIVLIRHAEKPANDLGQLTFQGLNRALALPDVLIGKYGKADYVFAPSTQKELIRDGVKYSYIRALITIEPTAIRLGVPVNARLDRDEIEALQKELLSPAYSHALIFVAWEHLRLDTLVKNMMKALGGDPKAVPEWPEKDYDSIFVLKIRTDGEKRSVTFQQDHEGLDGLSTEEPGPKVK
jgi:hypothetical protein